MRRHRQSVLAIAVLIAVACASTPLAKAGQAILDANTLYSEAMTLAGDLDRQGLVSDEQRQKILDAGHLAFGALTSAKEIYVATTSAADEDRVVAASLAALKAAVELKEIVSEVRRGHE
jgi:hypothetical protein